MTTTAAVRQVVHLALHPPPPLRRVVQVTDLLRRAALAHITTPSYPSMLSGHQAPGEPIRGSAHPHAHWLPVTDGKVIGGVCVWTPAGLAEHEHAALLGIRRLGGDGHHPLPAMAVTPVPGQLPLPARYTGPARVWQTLTPMVMPRRPDRPARCTPEWAAEQVTRELAARGLDAPARVVELPGPVTGWQTRRPSRPELVPRPRHIRLVFDHPVAGPIVLGRLAHFGLGLFTPHPEEEAAC